MQKHLYKMNIFLLLLALCLSLSGCSNNQSFTGHTAAVAEADTFNAYEVSQNKEFINQDGTVPEQRMPKIIPVSTTLQDTNAVSASDSGKASSKSGNTGTTFKKVSETVYASANVNLRSSCSTAEDNIVTVLKKGQSIKRIGIQKEWSKLLYKDKICYAKTVYLTRTSKTAADESLLNSLKIASKTNQLVLVVGNRNTGSTVSFYTKDDKGKWNEQFNAVGNIGVNGITYNKKEGDLKTPAGVYSFTLAFGLKADPGASLPYRQITKYDYWVDDIHSPYYNTWVNSKKIPGNYTSEHLIDHKPSYNYALSLNYNSKNKPGLGSAIFLHVYSGSGHTAGCIAIPEEDVKLLVKKINRDARIIIVPSSADLAKY